MARRSAPQDEIEPKVFSGQAEIDTAIERLSKRLSEVEKLRADRIQHDNPIVRTIESNIQNTILDIFGPKSPEYKEHRYYDIWEGGYYAGQSEAESQECFEKGITKTEVTIQGLIDRIKEKYESIPQAGKVSREEKGLSRNVFVVHGRDEEQKQSAARFIEKIGYNAVILHEQANEGKTILEKFETHADVAFAVILISPDDVGCARIDYVADASNLRQRARQNVVFEFGYFAGKISRQRVCALVRDEVEIPSDIHGLLYIPYDQAGTWRFLLAKEMKQAGLDVDLNKTY